MKFPHTILILDEVANSIKYLSDIITNQGYAVHHAKKMPDSIAQLKVNTYILFICCFESEDKKIIPFLENIKILFPHLPVIIISSISEVNFIVDVMKKGVADYLPKPLHVDKLFACITQHLPSNNIKFNQQKLKSRIAQQMVGDSHVINQLKQTIEKVSVTDARVLITGENGVGKELVAKCIHEKSKRKSAPLIEVNCAAIPGELIESELFGHEKGAFTSAVKQHMGKFEQANGGTLFLDEIGDMSLQAQAKVLRVLEDGIISRVGSDKSISVNVRLISATNKDLFLEVKKNNFRLDLYHRISIILIYVPSLNQRVDDIPLLIQYFLKELSEVYHTPVKKIHSEAVQALQEYHWTGNIRELRNIMERLYVLSDNEITLQDVIHYVTPSYYLNGVSHPS